MLDIRTLDENGLLQLCTDNYSESNILDFKRELPAKTDEDKKEFMKDVCAFANSEGGQIIYGIAESNGTAGKIFPATEMPDPCSRRLLGILDGVEPRIHGVQIKEISVDGGWVYVVNIPKSFVGPHCLRPSSNVRRFVFRDGTRAADMSYDQIRTAFDRTATLTARAQDFAKRRLELIGTGRGGRPMRTGPLCVVHMVPLSGVAGTLSVDVRKVHAGDPNRLIASRWNGIDTSYNVDGLMLHPGTVSGVGYAYTQLFRTGAIEMVSSVGVTQDQEKLIPARPASYFFRTGILKCLTFASAEDYPGPAILSCALLKCEGYKLEPSGHYWVRVDTRSDRDDLLLPELWIEDAGSPPDVDEVARPLLDILWQGFNFERCAEYADDGKWKAQ